MAVIFLESGGSGPGGDTGVVSGATAAAYFYNGTPSGSVVVQTTVKEHGYSSLKHDSAASASAYRARNACLADAGRRISVRMRFDGLPASTTAIIRTLTSGNATCQEIRLDSAGKLRLYAGATGGTLVQTGSTVLSTSTWYRISFAYTITSAGVNEFRVYLDGSPELTGTNVASSVTATANLRLGWTGTTPGANVLMYTQDVYVDDSSALTDPGDIRVTAKKPAAAGATNAFDTLVGTGTNRWDRVSERPINTSNGMTQAGTSTVREQFTVEAAAVGDDDLTGATILEWVGWTHFSVVAAAGSTLATPIINGVDTAYTTVSGSGVYQTTYHLAGSTSYPSSNTAIGLKSTGSAVDTLLRECGVMIAYTIPSDTPVSATDTETLDYTDTASATAALTATDTETLDYVDTATNAYAPTVADAETLDYVDTATVTVPKAASDAETLDYVDTATLAAALTATDTETLDYVDTATAPAAITATDTETLDYVDTPTLAAAISTADTETLDYVDTANVTVPKAASDTETLDYVDTTTLAAALAAVDAETLDYVDTASLRVTVTDTETLDYVDTAALSAALVAADTETLDYVDVATVAMPVARRRAVMMVG